MRGIAAVNAQIVADGEYTTDDGAVVVVGPALRAAVSGTASHPPDGLIDVPHTATGHRTSFEVTAEKSLQAARRLHVAGARNIAVLNFASARNPGGGYLGGAKAQESRIRLALGQRAERVLAVAAHHGARQLVLGSWGCGVFRNDPHDVADAFHTHLTAGGAFSTAFERVVFAVWGRSPDSVNRAAFADRFRFNVPGSGP